MDYDINFHVNIFKKQYEIIINKINKYLLEDECNKYLNWKNKRINDIQKNKLSISKNLNIFYKNEIIRYCENNINDYLSLHTSNKLYTQRLNNILIKLNKLKNNDDNNDDDDNDHCDDDKDHDDNVEEENYDNGINIDYNDINDDIDDDIYHDIDDDNVEEMDKMRVIIFIKMYKIVNINIIDNLSDNDKYLLRSWVKKRIMRIEKGKIPITSGIICLKNFYKNEIINYCLGIYKNNTIVNKILIKLRDNDIISRRSILCMWCMRMINNNNMKSYNVILDSNKKVKLWGCKCNETCITDFCYCVCSNNF